MRTPRGFICAVLVLSTACPPGAGPDAGPTGAVDAGDDDAGVHEGQDAGVDAGHPAADQYCERIAPFFCDFYLRCGRMAVDDVATCEERFAAGCEGTFEPRYVGLEAAGLLALDADGLEQCEAHLSTVACEAQFFELSGPCAGIWRGEVGEGGACGFDVESFVCAPGTTCRLDLTLCGECVPANAVGESCAGEGCVADAWCQDGVCAARVAAGELCSPDDRCVLGASCEAGVCRFPDVVAVGAMCDADRRCPYETACVGGVCVATPTLGGACDANTPCSAGYCDEGVCVPFSGPDEACGADGECFANRCGDDGLCVGYPSGCFD